MMRILPLLASLTLAACHESSSGGGNRAPATPVVEILGPWTGAPGLVVDIRFVASDTDSAATSAVVAVPLFAGASEIVLAPAIPEQDGLEELLAWDTSGVPEGAWTIEVRTSDGQSTTSALCPDRIELGDLGTFPRVVTDGSGTLLLASQAPQSGGGALVTGSFFGDIGLGEGSAGALTLDGSFERRELFLARYAPDGAFDWVARTRGRVARGGSITSSAWPHALLALDGGGALAVGALYGEVVFGPGEARETTVVLPGDQNTNLGGLFVSRWHGDGTLAWVRQGSGVSPSALSVRELPDGGFLVAGSSADYQDPAIVLGPLAQPEHELDGSSTAGGFLATYDRDGELLAAQGVPLPVTGLSSIAAIQAFDVSTAGEVYVAGWFGGSVQVAEGGSVVSSPSPQDLELFVARVPASTEVTRGITSWVNASQSASVGFVSPLDVAALPGGGCALAAARYDTAVTFDGGLASEVVLGPPDVDGELFLAAYTATGALRFARDTGIVDPADGLVPFSGTGLVALADGTLVLATLVDLDDYGLTLTLAPDGPDALELFIEGEEALVLSGWSPDGELLWAIADGGSNPSLDSLVLERRPGGDLLLLGRGADVLGAFTQNETLIPPERAFFLARYGEDGSF